MRTPYELTLESRVPGGRSTYRFRTADGVHAKRSFRTSELLLLDELWDAGPFGLLCPEANYGVVGTVFADAAESVVMTESSARAATLCARNAAANGADAAVQTVADLPTLDGAFDAVAVAPKPDTALAVGCRRLADALALIRPGGRLFLAASRRSGLARYEACLAELGADPTRVSARGDCHLVRATRPQTVDPPTYVEPRTLTPTVDGVELSLATVPGLFAASGLDDGTRLLLEATSVDDGDRVLDLCCGYGAVGCYAALTADCDVWLSDDDRVATACAACSLDATGADGSVVTADCVEGVADRTFDRVLCNPPTHAGDGVLSELLAGAHDVLAADGRFSLVHHRALDLGTHLAPFESVRTVRTGDEHVVLEAKL